MLFSEEEEGNVFHAHRIKDCNSLTLTNTALSLSTGQLCAADTGFWIQNQYPSWSHTQVSMAICCFKPLFPPKTVMM